LLVLLAMLPAGRDASGIPIARDVQQGSGRAVALGSVYTALARLEHKGLVSLARVPLAACCSCR